ncbi:hypothetical protein V1387_12750 [Allomuricauda taeanensis]|uniref:hypothetical protein n=1 Tax=Flagellimonas taeanensis TaxID=1005926 RepID=UPI002E7AD1ED|nr:hypothetical protein [Allomuricauda taeanensis]MEE1963559.1 hypothetical protein [Allomuricauda taeanensis]
MKKLSMADFQLKGNSYYNFGNGLKVNNDRLTNELVIEFLKVNPERIKLFSKYPGNWKDLVGITPKSKILNSLTKWFK